ncbi:MAG: hypothetical protein K2X57_22975, partial [Xanthobacteraceae bacterium]|nr:hypothetical protein [Xanthobacteraceae bacterium]
ANGEPETPADLDRHTFVLFSFLQAGNELTFTHRSGATARVSMHTRFGINNVGAIERAVLAGAGLHAGPLWLFAPLAAAGRLVHVMPDWAAPLYPVHAIHNFGRRAPAKVSKFIDHIADELRKLDGIVR